MDIHSTDALLLIDLQNDFMPGGSLAVADGDAILPVINRLAHKFEHVVATEDWHPANHISFAETHGKQPFSETVQVSYGTQALWPVHCVQNTAGADLHAGLNVDHLELILRKGFRKNIDSYSAFLENDHLTPTGLSGYLRERGITRLFFAGLAYDYCVGSSAIDGAELGFDCYLIEDATRGIAEPTKRAMEERLKVAGVTILRSEDI